MSDINELNELNWVTDELVPEDSNLLGFASTNFDNRARWTELAIYKCPDSSYIVAGCGRSTLDEEVDRTWAYDCYNPWEVVDALRMPEPGENERWFISRIGVKVLKYAARKDKILREIVLRVLRTRIMGTDSL